VLVAGRPQVELWDLSTKQVFALRHDTTVREFAVRQGHIATVSGRTLTLWDAKTRSRTARQLPVELTHVVFNARGDRVLAASGGERRAWIYDVPKLALVKALKSDSLISTIAIDPTGNRVVLAPPSGPAQLMDSS